MIRYALLFALLFGAEVFHAQIVKKQFSKDSVAFYIENQTLQNKIIPEQCADVVKIALLYYPELAQTHIEVKIKRQLSPFAARPKPLSVFRRPSKRKYRIFVSSSSIDMLERVLFANLRFNAQIGVIGHELSHIADYQLHSGLYLIRVGVMQLNKKKTDKFEFNTDKRAIQHGLGFQLLSWSMEIRKKLNIKQWSGADNIGRDVERYMNPETIVLELKETEAYQRFYK